MYFVLFVKWFFLDRRDDIIIYDEFLYYYCMAWSLVVIGVCVLMLGQIFCVGWCAVRVGDYLSVCFM